MLLIDEIMSASAAQALDGKSRIDLSERLKTVTKFVVNPDFVEAADALFGNKGELEKMMPFCKLPFERMWIEFPATHRISWLNVTGERENVFPNRQIKRIGYLFEPHPTITGASSVSLFWQLTSDAPLADDYKISFSVWQNEISDSALLGWQKFLSKTGNMEKELLHFMWWPGEFVAKSKFGDWESEIHIASWARRFVLNARIKMGEKKTDDFLSSQIANWDGEMLFIFSLLALLNTRNVAEREFVDKREHNIKRARVKKPALFSYYVLKIRKRLAADIRDAMSSEVSRGGVRLHFVRGHWKHRKSGVYWWHPFKRGNKKLGEVRKDYEVV